MSRQLLFSVLVFSESPSVGNSQILLWHPAPKNSLFIFTTLLYATHTIMSRKIAYFFIFTHAQCFFGFSYTLVSRKKHMSKNIMYYSKNPYNTVPVHAKAHSICHSHQKAALHAFLAESQRHHGIPQSRRRIYRKKDGD